LKVKKFMVIEQIDSTSFLKTIFFILFLLGYKTLFQFPGIFNAVFRPGLGFKPSLGYQVEVPAVPEGEDITAKLCIVFKDVQPGGGEFVGSARELMEQIEKKNKKFCQDIMHSPIEIPSSFNISLATSPNLHLTKTPNST
jgi:hypothetical protein